MKRSTGSILLIVLLLVMVAGCNQAIDGYTAASAISRNGFAINGDELRKLDGQQVAIWGYVDQGNLYGDASARQILGEWWSGAGPTATSWQFNLKANADDAVGRSFAVFVPNDAGRDDLLEVLAADARAQRPTRVFVKGRLYTFDAPGNFSKQTGLYMEVASSGDILLVSSEDE